MQNITVSVCVITFNSENTILETLDSIKAQSYGSKNIELIIADDCSTDNTKLIVEQWIALNQHIFNKIEFIPHKKNKGVSHNINTAWKSATSSWIKTIAGDDILSINCIDSNIKFIESNESVRILFSYMRTFYEENGHLHYDRTLPEKENLPFFKLNSKLQFQFLLINSFNIAPSSFIHRKVLQDVLFADERFSLIEDLPLWLKITQHGYTLHINPEVTVYYRISNSLSNSVSRFTNIPFTQEIINVHKILIKPYIKGFSYIYYYDKIFELKTNLLIAKITNNKRNIISYSLQKLCSLFRPRWHAIQLKRVITKCIG